jgi:hypothetical protein
VTRPSYLYAFGNEGGPYKVGFSSDPRSRAKHIVGCQPGSLYAPQDAAFLRLIRLPDRRAAKAAEALVHAALEAHRVGHRDADGRPIGTLEWFAADLETVLAAMAKAVADAPGAEVCETGPPSSADIAMATRIRPDTKEALGRAAAADDRSVSSLTELVLRGWLVERGYLPRAVEGEKLAPREPQA